MTNLQRRRQYVLALAVTAVALLHAAPLAAQRPGRLKVYVGAEETPGDFVDADRGVQSSIKDLQFELGERWREFTVVKTRTEADITLIVLGRGALRDGGAVAAPIGKMTVLAPTSRNIVDVSLRVRDYTKTIIGTGSTWRGSARSIVKDVRAWVTANRERLRRGTP